VVWAWGLNGNRQCGIDTSRPEAHEDIISVPTQVDGLHPDKHNGARVVEISGGEFHSLFLFDNGEVWGCGRNDSHELGLSEDHPAQDDVRERTRGIHEEKQKVIDEAQKALDKISESGDEEAIAAATLEVQGAQSSLRIAPVEWVPEPVRVSPPLPSALPLLVVFNTCRWRISLIPDLLPPSPRIIRSSPRTTSSISTSP
jgi:regulator of chromosome condensation